MLQGPELPHWRTTAPQSYAQDHLIPHAGMQHHYSRFPSVSVNRNVHVNHFIDIEVAEKRQHGLLELRLAHHTNMLKP